MYVSQTHPTADGYNNCKPFERIQIRCRFVRKMVKADLLQMRKGGANCNMVLYPANY